MSEEETLNDSDKPLEENKPEDGEVGSDGVDQENEGTEDEGEDEGGDDGEQE